MGERALYLDDAHARGAGAGDDDFLVADVLRALPLGRQGPVDAGQHRRRRSLNVVIEHQVVPAVPAKRKKESQNVEKKESKERKAKPNGRSATPNRPIASFPPPLGRTRPRCVAENAQLAGNVWLRLIG